MSQPLESFALADRFCIAAVSQRWSKLVSLAQIFACCVCGAGAVLGAEAASDKRDAPPIDYEPNLPIVFLQSTNQIVGERDRKVPCTIKVLSTRDATIRETKPLPASVRFHGASSQGYPKKSFSFTLTTPAALLGMPQSPHWVLNAAYIDRSLMRHKLSYDLFRSLSTPPGRRFAAASEFVEVYFNGSYYGAYLLMQRVDAQLLEFRPYNSNDVSHACIYKAVDHAGGFGNPGHGGYDQREPDLLHPYWKPLDQFSRFVSSASDAQFFDPAAGLASRLDLDNAIDFHLLVLLTSNMDGTDKNFIIARNADGSGPSPVTQRFFFVPWDYDATFGRNWNATPVESSHWLSNHLLNRLLGGTEYRKKFMARWKQLHNGPFSPKKIHSMMDENVQTLGPAVQRNAKRWPLNQGTYPDSLDFTHDIAEMKSWTEARVKWLDQEIDRRLGESDK